MVFPYQWLGSAELMRLEPNRVLLIDEPQQLMLKAIDTEIGEILVIVSRSPMEKAVKTLASIAAELNRSKG
ncbi:hypothetical protein [Microcoleus sp. FACHB-672]|uniref:hypothetical protein n=1 Tax=Microcoleus sp. FACHB-672 TaxID=2692825 RepID=UPI0016866975|nr:hypothetical protein [Microcoleus sp. FACHB-672]MBD2039594.1 hypothetical protein [Microcoleus sp. FACHB-672]